MAPRKRKAEDGPTLPVVSTRVTRNGGRRSADVVDKNLKEKVATTKLPKKARRAPKKQVSESKIDEQNDEVNDDTETGLENLKESENDDIKWSDKTVVVEHCKQCNSFKTRAVLVKDGLEKVPGVVVQVNPDKPRRGCFEIRLEGGETFISLLDMKRPFKPMKDLDMDKVIADIVDKIQG